MTEYRVVWEIDIQAETPQEAAEQALAIQRRPDSTALVFEVYQRKDLNSVFRRDPSTVFFHDPTGIPELVHIETIDLEE